MAYLRPTGIAVLALITQTVIKVEPWLSPRYVVPLAGMIFAGSMNFVSLAAERFQAESDRGISYLEAWRPADDADSDYEFVVRSWPGVLPGMMTAQMLSGVSPLVAAKYQIVVMTMLFAFRVQRQRCSYC